MSASQFSTPNDLFVYLEEKLREGGGSPEAEKAIDAIALLQARLYLAGEWQRAAVKAAIPLEVLAGSESSNLHAPSTYEAIVEGRNAVRALLGTPVLTEQSLLDAPPSTIEFLSKLRPALREVLWCALVWNDHNYSEKDIRTKAALAAKALGFERADSRDAELLLEHFDTLLKSYAYPDGWIPVEHGLPEPNKTGYLVSFEDMVAIAYITPTTELQHFPEGKRWHGHGGSHNMVRAYKPVPAGPARK